jgi:uncharacterized cupin superfamily protein
MEHVTIENIDTVVDSAIVKHPLTDALDASNLAINYHELVPGDRFAYGYHMHETQDEIFLIQSGTVVFETEDGTVDVEGGEAIRFAPGDYQRGENRGTDRVEAFAIGAPQKTGQSEILRKCVNCGGRISRTIEWCEDRDAKRTRCEECGEITGRFD